MARPRNPARVLPPIYIAPKHGRGVGRWRVRVIASAGKGSAKSFRSEIDPTTGRDRGQERATKWYLAQDAELGELTGLSVEAALVQFKQEHLMKAQRNGENSVNSKMHNLRLLFGPIPADKEAKRPGRPGVMKDKLGLLPASKYSELYKGKFVGGQRVEDGLIHYQTRFKRPIATQTQQNALAAGVDFLNWAVEQKVIEKNFFQDVKPVGGEPNAGKQQLSTELADIYLGVAMAEAAKGDIGAVAAMLPLVIDLRGTEVATLTRMQIDNNGTVVWVMRGKSRKAKRRLKIPGAPYLYGQFLQDCLRHLSKGLGFTDPVFGYSIRGTPRSRHWLLGCVRHIAELAKIPFKVCSQGLRGTHATLSAEEGTSGENLMRSMGHESIGVTERAYLKPGARESGAAKLVGEAMVRLQEGKGKRAKRKTPGIPAKWYARMDGNKRGTTPVQWAGGGE